MEFMNIHTRESIEIDYIFNMISPKTPYGIEKKKNMKPYLNAEREGLEQEFENIEILLGAMEKHDREFREIFPIFKEIKEIRGSLRRVENGIVLDEVELFEIKNFIFCIKELCDVLSRVENIPQKLKPSRSLGIEKLLDPEGIENRTFYLYDCYSEMLKGIRQQKRNLQNRYDREKKNTISCIENEVGVGLKLSGEVTVQKRDSSLMEKAKGCPWLIEESSTLLVTTFKLKKSEELIRLQDEIEDLKLEEEKEEYKVRQDLSAGIRANLADIYGIINYIGDLDLLTAKAEFSNDINGVRPVIHDGLWVEVENGRHIKLEEILKSQGKVFTGVTCPLKSGVTVITGANMGGKTVRLKLMGMLQAMTQYGLHVPVEKFDTCLFDYVYFSIGDMQSIDSGLSTFGAEIKGMMEILGHSEYSGLILIDELARGTNPNEGYAISRAIARYLKDKNSITLFTTHFAGITREEGVSHLRVRGLKKVDFDKLKTELAGTSRGMELVQEYMDYTLETVDKEYDVPKDALNIARLMGLDEKILGWAEEILLSGREE